MYLHQVSSKSIEAAGASQFSIIKKYLMEKKNEYDSKINYKYIYFACGVGYDELIEEELRYAEEIAKELLICGNVKLLIRPYPFAQSKESYKKLLCYNNVVIEKYNYSPSSIEEFEKVQFDKFKKIENALAFFHLGTTIGYEAAYFNVPVIKINYEIENTKKLKIMFFMRQYQNQKYLNTLNSPNVINARVQLSSVLNEIIDGDIEKYLSYNKLFRSTTPLKSFEEIARYISN
jgi:hypothetical protein